MKIQSTNALSFYREVSTSGDVWTIRGDQGIPTFNDKDGNSIVFLWSSHERVKRIIEKEELFRGTEPLSIPWALFASKWLPDIADQQIVFSLNWTGNKGQVWEESAEEVAVNMQAHIDSNH